MTETVKLHLINKLQNLSSFNFATKVLMSNHENCVDTKEVNVTMVT